MDVNSYNYAGKSALHICAASRTVGAAQFLQYMLEKGADVDFQDYQYNTALMDASAANESECVQVLLDWGADQYLCNHEGNNAMTIATLKDRAGSLEVLTQYGWLSVFRACVCL